MLWLIIVIVLLSATTAVLLARIFIMRKAADEICREFSDKLKNDTNTLISISSRDKAMCRLADNINVQLKELRKARRRFLLGDTELKNAVTNISHDLRTPLTAICGYLDLLEQEDKSEAAEHYIKIIENRAEMLKQLTEELFLYSVVITTGDCIQTSPVSINEVLEESIAAFYMALKERKISPNIQMPEATVFRSLDRAALSRVLSNLLHNAMKYSDGDLDITLMEEGKIVFSNTATGLNEVLVGKLFDRFYTIETARRSTGLGLAIAKSLVEQMSGTITAHYSDGKLSICILLPKA